MRAWKLFFIFAMLVGVAGCEIGYTRITNNYPEPIRLRIISSGSNRSLDVTLSSGQNVIYREPGIYIESIEVTAPDGKVLNYDMALLKRLAQESHQKIEAVRWSLTPEGVLVSPH